MNYLTGITISVVTALVISAVIGFFAYIKDSVKRKDVEAMIKTGLEPVVIKAHEGLEQSKENFKEMQQVKNDMTKIRGHMGQISVSLQTLAQLVLTESQRKIVATIPSSQEVIDDDK